MQPFLDLRIREQIARYVAGEIGLVQLQEWLTPVIWGVEESNNPDAINLAYQVELYLAEFSHGHRTEEELRTLLRPLAESYSVCYDLAGCLQTVTSSSTTITSILGFPQQLLADRPPATASA